MEVGNRRSTSSRNGVVSGSVWENRIRLDEVGGGIKVFCNSEEENDSTSGNKNQVDKKLDMGPKPNVDVVGSSGKRKTWKAQANPIQIADGIGMKKVSKSQNVKSEFLNGNVKSKSEVDARMLKKSILEKKPVIGINKTKCEGNSKEFDKFITSYNNNNNNRVEKPLDSEEEWDDVLEEEIDDLKQIPLYTTIHSNSVSGEFQRRHSKLQSIVDLVMWRHVPKSALVFGIGTFVIILSSFTHNLNISFISVLAYLGLLHLSAIFLFRSLIHRGTVDIGESTEYVVGEEEAMWALNLFLPCVNEFLLNIRALFSGDPATTMKMAVVLFLLAQFGSSITIWKVSKLGFFGVFIIPKICSSYSTQLNSHGTFWIRYLRDAWESCTHKKAVVFAIFALVWNISSIISRIWAVFMVYAGYKYYQQTLTREDANLKDDSSQGKTKDQRQVGRKSSLPDTRKHFR